MKKLIIATALLAFVLVGRTNAQLIENFSGGDSLSVGPGTAGFEFTVGAEPLTLQTLGVFDEFSDGVLNSSHAVGVWSSTGTLLASVTVSPDTATEINSFFYQNLAAPLTLQAGSTFRLAAQYSDADLDLARGNVPLSSVTVNDGITLKDAYLSSGSGFDFPDLNVSGANQGFFGPNAGFAPVPEPSTYAFLTALGLVAFAFYRRLRSA